MYVAKTKDADQLRVYSADDLCPLNWQILKAGFLRTCFNCILFLHCKSFAFFSDAC